MQLTKEQLEQSIKTEISDNDFSEICLTLKEEGLELTLKNAIDLLKSLKEVLKYTKQIEDSFYDWAMAYFYIEGNPFNPEKTGWNFWIDIYKRGEEAKVVMRKASQIGATFYAFARALYHTCAYPDKYFRVNNIEKGTKNASGSVLYVFPTDTDMGDLVKSKFDPIVDESQYIVKKMTQDGSVDSKKDIDNISSKKIGSNYVYFRGSQNQRKLKSITGGLVVLDEYAEIAEGVDTLVVKRMNAQSLKTMLFLSNPEEPDLNIDAEFKKGTMDYYYVSCPHCKRESTPNFFTHHNYTIIENQDEILKVNPEFELSEVNIAKLSGKPRWVCPHCLEDFIPSANGKWRSSSPDAKFRSYHIPLIISPACDPDQEWELWKKAQTDENEKANFYKHNLGLPYVNSSNALSMTDLVRCKRNYSLASSSSVSTTMGVDWGMYDHYYVIGENKGDGASRIIACGKVQTDEEIMELIVAFRVKDFACDLYGKSGGGMETVKKILAKMRTKGVNAVGCTHANMKSAYTNANAEVGVMNYDKSKCIDRLYNRIRAQMTELPMNIPVDFMEHHCTFVRENREDGGFLYVSKTGKKVPDHYQSAHYFNTVAMDISDLRISSSCEPMIFIL